MRNDSLNIELETVAPWDIKRAHQQAKQGWNILTELFDTPDTSTPYSTPESVVTEYSDANQESILREETQTPNNIVDEYVQSISSTLQQRYDELCDDLSNAAHIVQEFQERFIENFPKVETVFGEISEKVGDTVSGIAQGIEERASMDINATVEDYRSRYNISPE